ncbi:hypothetical protein [uncultured Clostridium sp.]|uniref:hypothetical protein n=1 Tax=uncultured Clostridium sp. TaxID=59620 RepID=UPI00260ABBBE|nr:hypothetical protein [uncultured Clostridium sp.]
MKELFNISGVSFTKEEFQDDINEYMDIVDIIKEFEGGLKIQDMECAALNDCCNKTKVNKFTEIIGVLTEEDDFLTLEEVRARQKEYENTHLEPFGIQVYKCNHCEKWMINILEAE